MKTHLEGIDQETWKETLLAQFTVVSGGEIEYDGKSFRESLGEMGIAEETMDLVADQLTIALEMNEAWPEDVDELLVALELKEAEMVEEEMTEEEDADGVSDHGETVGDRPRCTAGTVTATMPMKQRMRVTATTDGHDADGGDSDGDDADGEADTDAGAEDAPRK